MNTNVLCAVFKRNFVNYFANPTGYVFICVFLLLSSCAAFRPSEFFTANLCNLDALNGAITLILLFFVPAITMGVWADESRQGTDELLLTIPAGDLEIVLGKYLACRRHLHGGAGRLGGLQLYRPPPTRRARLGALPFQLSGLLVPGTGDAVDRHGGLVPHAEHHRGLHPRRGAERPGGPELVCRHAAHGSLFLGDGRQAMEPGRAVPGVRPRDHRPLRAWFSS